jgi:hypothetical protein
MLMNRYVVRLLGTAGLAALLAVAARHPAEAAEDKAATRSFKMTLVSELTMDIGGKTQKLNADTGLFYSLQRGDKETTLLFDAIEVKVVSEGKELMNTQMSREKLKTVKDGKTQEVARADAPPELKKMLEDSFGAPICQLVLEKNGKEIKRTVVAGPGAKSLVDNGQIANARFFHALYATGDTKWESPNEISMGNGGYAKGKLTYEKIKGAKAGQTKVKVSGRLTADSVTLPGNPLTIKDAKYDVTGDQTYDAAVGDWVAGDLVIQVFYAMEAGGKAVGTAKGTMKVKLELLPAK